MLLSYIADNFVTLMILFAIIVMMFANRDTKIPATNLFIVSLVVLFAITIVAIFDTDISVDGLSEAEAHRIIMRRTIACTFAYILRPCVILAEIMIILQSSKRKLLCLIPAVVNAVIYSATLFGYPLAFYINEDNHWRGGPLRFTVFIVQFIYLIILLYCTIKAFTVGDKRKSLILVMIFLQAVLVAVHEYNSSVSYSNEVTALCILEYYIFLTTTYRQELNKKLDSYVEELETADTKLKNLAKEVMETLTSAIDAKDNYTRGHSMRVAQYSKRLAELNFKTPQECEEIYYAALLHDVGKIGISDAIITKNGKLTKEEYEEIKQHPVLGKQILERISEFPFLAVGAEGHHERYDGKGYPNGLKGKEIPEIARIISVADAYDAMTSKRSYRDTIPQQIVREELVKGAGTQFDPVYARLMLHMIDDDTAYEMCEREDDIELTGNEELVVEEHRSRVTPGIQLTAAMTTLSVQVDALGPDREPVPSLIIFDSLDSNVHTSEKKVKDLNYFEYCEIWFDGRTEVKGARKTKTETMPKGDPKLKANEYLIEAVRIGDHMLLRTIGREQTVEVTVALPDSTRFVYACLTGENCRISNVIADKAETEFSEDYIPRIAEKISYINVPAGDLPNVQIDGYRTDASEGVEIRDGLQITFHAKNLPTARLVWHCPFVDIFCSDDGVVKGESYRDLAFMRFDGEAWECDVDCSMRMNVKRLESFEGWEAWKNYNREGFDATVTFRVEDNLITVITENAGISMENTAVLRNIDKKVYASITGDQVAITNICVK